MNPGFYKYDGIDFFYGPNAVYAPTYTLLAEAHTTYDYPVDGWTWFDDQDTAYQQLNYTPPVNNPAGIGWTWDGQIFSPPQAEQG